MAKGDAGAPHLSMGGLSVGPVAGSGGGVTGVTDADVAVETRQCRLIEDLGDESHVFEHCHGLTV